MVREVAATEMRRPERWFEPSVRSMWSVRRRPRRQKKSSAMGNLPIGFHFIFPDPNPKWIDENKPPFSNRRDSRNDGSIASTLPTRSRIAGSRSVSGARDNSASFGHTTARERPNARRRRCSPRSARPRSPLPHATLARVARPPPARAPRARSTASARATTASDAIVVAARSNAPHRVPPRPHRRRRRRRVDARALLHQPLRGVRGYHAGQRAHGPGPERPPAQVPEHVQLRQHVLHGRRQQYGGVDRVHRHPRRRRRPDHRRSVPRVPRRAPRRVFRHGPGQPIPPPPPRANSERTTSRSSSRTRTRRQRVGRGTRDGRGSGW